jgi:hypothetical protein
MFKMEGKAQSKNSATPYERRAFAIIKFRS